MCAIPLSTFDAWIWHRHAISVHETVTNYSPLAHRKWLRKWHVRCSYHTFCAENLEEKKKQRRSSRKKPHQNECVRAVTPASCTYYTNSVHEFSRLNEPISTQFQSMHPLHTCDFKLTVSSVSVCVCKQPVIKYSSLNIIILTYYYVFALLTLPMVDWAPASFESFSIKYSKIKGKPNSTLSNIVYE